MQASPFSYHKLNTNNTKTIQNHSKPKAFQNQNFNSHKLLHSYHNFVQVKVFLKIINTSLYTNKKKTNQETF